MEEWHRPLCLLHHHHPLPLVRLLRVLQLCLCLQALLVEVYSPPWWHGLWIALWTRRRGWGMQEALSKVHICMWRPVTPSWQRLGACASEELEPPLNPC